MTIKQYVQNEDVKRKLFNWNWVTRKPEKFEAYNKLLEYFLSIPEVKKLDSKREVLFYWYLYMGTLQDHVLNGKNEKSNGIVKKCPLLEKELKILFEK